MLGEKEIHRLKGAKEKRRWKGGKRGEVVGRKSDKRETLEENM